MARAQAMSMSESADLKRVEIDALVILQIMKHCRQKAPSPVTGQLLGLDVDGVVQLTHSFGYLTNDGDDQNWKEEDGEQYQLDVMKRLREVNVDCHNAGWYQTASLGQFFSDSAIETQYYFQQTNALAIMLVYDPLQSRIGKPAFKALRLTKEFMAKYTESQESNKTALNNFPSGEMFEEVPIVITSLAIVESFLVDWAIMDPTSTTQIDTLNVENQVFLEKNVQLLIGALGDLAEEQNKMQMYERNALRQQDPKGGGKGKRQSQPPKALDTMIYSQQIQNYCKQINTSASDAFGKVYLLSNKPKGLSK